MKIIRHTARDMRQALRAVREQLGEDAVILSSRRTDGGVEVTAAVDFDAATLEAGGFAEGRASAEGAGTAPAPAPVPARALAPAPAAPPVLAAAPMLIAAPRAAAIDPEPVFVTSFTPAPAQDSEWISAAARAAIMAPVLSPAEVSRRAADGPGITRTEVPVFRGDPAMEQAYASSLSPFGASENRHAVEDSPGIAASRQSGAQASNSAAEAMGQELKTLRRMLETQLAHLAWNDRMRRAPIHTEILRELTEIGISHDLAERLVKQLPDDTDLTFARRFTIAGLSQYLHVTGDRWLDDGGRVAFAGTTGAGKTTTLAKVAVRWVLRHGSRDIALVAADAVRIGAQDQLQSLGQLLGVPVYTPESFAGLPALLSRLHERLVLIDTPGSNARDPELIERLAALAQAEPKVQTTLVLSASMQAAALDEAVRRFAPANPSCCVLTKLDEAASLGGLLSILIRARLPVSYVSEGQRVPEDLRPARALELVSAAVQLAKSSGAAADEDLLRRRFGKTGHGIT